MTASLHASRIFLGATAGVEADVALSHGGGVITTLAPEPGRRDGRRTFVIPGLVNAHDHARPAMTSFGAGNMPLETWIARSAFGTPPDAYLAALVPLARAAMAGCCAMMVHYTRPSGRLDAVAEACQIARAAGDIGLRLAFAPAVRDQNPLVYGDDGDLLAGLPAAAQAPIEDALVRTGPSPGAYLDTVEAIAAAIGGPMVDVQFGPAGVQWCSRPLLEAIAERSAATGRRVHMHLLETVYQRQWADSTFPGGVVRHLADIGLLSPRLTVAHCVHARPDELELLADAGCTLVTNFSSNLHLHSGLAPIAAAYRRGCRIAVGTDGVALDEDGDAIREMRLVQLMHDGVGFERTWSRPDYLAHVTGNGRAAVGAPGDGMLRPGAAADFVVLDLDVLDRDTILPVDPLDLLFARGNAGCVAAVVVAGRTVVRDGRPTGIDLGAAETELRAQFRAAMPRYAELERCWRPFETAVSRWFRSTCGCS